MKIERAETEDISVSLKIAGELKEWFTNDALKKMEKDFKKNLIVASNEKVIGFLNYKISNSCARILWIGVDRKYRRKDIGKKLLKKLEKIAGEDNVSKIIVNTLSYEDNYEPYKSTRNFYLKNGFTYGRVLPKKKGEDEQVEMEKML